MKLPAWLKQAIKEQVVTKSEAQELFQICLQAETEQVVLPEHLWPAAERIDLWEQPAWPTVQ